MNFVTLKNPQCQRGFTLIEVIITLSIAAILIGFTVPAFIDFIEKIRLINATNALHNAMQLARTEAIKRNGRVDLIAHNGSWKNGWIITADNQQIFNQEALHNDIHIDSTFKNKTKPYIAFNGTGRTRTDSNGAQAGTIHLSIGSNSRFIIVNFLGRIRICNPANTAGKTCNQH